MTKENLIRDYFLQIANYIVITYLRAYLIAIFLSKSINKYIEVHKNKYSF